MFKIPNDNQKGFSLIEVAIATVVIGLVSVLIASTMATQMEQRKALEMGEREDIIRSAIAEYIKKDPADPADVMNYPCPADPALPRGDEDFGKEQRDATGNCIVVGDIKQVVGTDGAPVFIGSIPTSTLGLSDVHALDVHNQKYLYAVSGAVAETDALTYGNVVKGAIQLNEDVIDEHGNIELDASGNPKIELVTSYAPFVFLSHGENGSGAYNASGKQVKPCNLADSGDDINCNGDAVFALRQLRTTDSSDEYDDVVTFNIEDKRITIENCPPGSMMAGVTKGSPICLEFDLTCPVDNVMVGVVPTANGMEAVCQSIPVAGGPPSLPRTGNPSTPRFVPPTSTRVSTSTPTASAPDEGWLGAAYRETFGRAPDAAGAEFWLAQEENGMSREEIISHISNSCEAQGTCNTTTAGRQEVQGQATYGTNFETRTGTSAASRATQSAARTTARTDSTVYNTPQKQATDSAVNNAQIRSLYEQNLGRAPDAAGAAHYQQQLNSGRSAADIAKEMANSCEAKGTC